MRNIGGSMGIAAVTTLLSRRSQVHTNILGSHVTPFDERSRMMLLRLKQALMARGLDAATAAKSAYGTVFGLVQRQATLISFVECFWLLGIIFLAAVPLLFLMKRPKPHAAPVAAH